MKKLLIIDALNLFIRNYVVNPSMDRDGNNVGGCIGFIKSLQKITREMKPDEIVVAWDGHGGSQRKRTMNKEYKEGRTPIRFNRRMISLSPEAQEKNKHYQHIMLMEYLNEMPVIQLVCDYVEADDVIAYVSQMEHYKGWKKYIVSSDKDFLQLINEEVEVYRPIKNQIIGIDTLMEEYGILPSNFALARAIAGDSSDNLKGVGRVGLKTLRKKIPLFGSQSIEINELMQHCNSVEKKYACHNKILENRKLIEDNYDIMQLYEPNMSYVNRQSIEYNVTNFEPEFNKLEITKKLFKDGLSHNNLEQLFLTFKKIRSNK